MSVEKVHVMFLRHETSEAVLGLSFGLCRIFLVAFEPAYIGLGNYFRLPCGFVIQFFRFFFFFQRLSHPRQLGLDSLSLVLFNLHILYTAAELWLLG